MKAANKDGWIRHRGGKCPVEKGVRVDVRYRNGEVSVNQPALERGKVADTWAESWDHDNCGADIMAYRLHKPAEQVTGTSLMTDLLRDDQKPVSVVMACGPLEWRDRITELNEERRTIDAVHKVNTARIECELSELVQKLASEGLQLLNVEKPVTHPVEDMSDWRNWRVGDFIECAYDTGSDGIKVGGVYRLTAMSDEAFGFRDDDGDARDRCDHFCFKFHSRPAK